MYTKTTAGKTVVDKEYAFCNTDKVNIREGKIQMQESSVRYLRIRFAMYWQARTKNGYMWNPVTCVDL